MPPTLLHLDFKTLRQAYNEVKNFIETESASSVPSLNTKIEEDLGCAGDDNAEFLEKFVTTYNLDITGFDYSKHFLSEGELFDSGTVLLMLLSLPFMLVFWLIKIFTFGKINPTKVRLFPDLYRQTIDMTFGDMLTWYLTGKYNLRKDVVVRLSKN